MENFRDREYIKIATSNVVNGLNACGLSLDLFYKLDDFCQNEWYDLAYDFVSDTKVKMSDADRCSLRYVFYHAMHDLKVLDAVDESKRS